MAKTNKKNKKRCEECKSYILSEIPTDIYSIIIQRQANLKISRVQGATIPAAIYTIIREWLMLNETKPVILEAKDGEYVVLGKMDEITKLHIVNAMNKKIIGNS